MGEGAAKHGPEHIGQVCPECAAPRSERTPATPWAVRHRMRVKFASLVLVLGYIVWQNVQAWPVMSAPSTYFHRPAVFPAHQYTRHDLEQYASGAITDGRLVGDLFNDYAFGSLELEVALIAPAGDRSGGVWYGWPTAIASYTRGASYDDVYAGTNPVITLGGSRSGWHGLTYFVNRFDAQGRYEAFNLNAKAFVLPLFMVVAAWSLGRALCFALVVTRVAAHDSTRVRDTVTRRVPILCAAACAIGVAAASFQPFRSPDYIRPTTTPTPCVKTGLTVADLARLSTEPNGDAVVAIAILEAIGEETTHTSDSLVFGFTSDAGETLVYGDGGWPEGHMFAFTEQVGRTDGNRQSRPRITLMRGGYSLKVVVRWGDPLERYDAHDISLVSMALIGFGLYAAWWSAGVAVWFIGWRVRQRAARRVARGWCARCGYDLSGL